MVAEAGTPASTGARLTSVTVRVISWVSVVAPSEAWTAKGLESGPRVLVGVQLKAPLVWSIDAPVGWPIRLKVRLLGGRSASVAVAVKVFPSRRSSDLEAGTPASTGARLTSVTVRVISWVSVVAP